MAAAKVELTDEQVQEVLESYLDGLGQDEAQELFRDLLNANFNTIDHVALVRHMAKYVETRCHLPNGTVLGKKLR